MAFDKMDDSACLVRKALNQFKWSDVEEVLGTYTTNKKNEVVAAANAAKQAQLRRPYAKVGVVKSKLVFRIKHEGGGMFSSGHWGDDDIVIVRGYEPPPPPGDAPTRALLTKSRVADPVTLRWWTDTKAESVADRGLAKALTDYEGLKGLIAARGKLTWFASAVQKLEAAEAAGKAIQGSLAHKDDKSIMQHFVFEVSKRQDELEAEQAAYTARLDTAADSVLDGADARVKDLDRTTKLVVTLTRSGDLDNANRQLAKAAQTVHREGSPVSAKQLRAPVNDAAGVNRVDEDDVMAAVNGKAKKGQIQRAYDLLPPAIQEAREALEMAEEVADNDYDHPDRATNKNPDYQRGLAEVNAGFKGVLAAINGATTYAKGRLNTAKQVARQVSALTVADPRVLVIANTIVDQLQAKMAETVREYAKIRNESGALKIRVKELGITMPDQGKFTTPLLNKCMSAWWKYRAPETEAYETLDAAMKSLGTKFPDIKGDTDAVIAKIKNGATE